MLRNIKELIGYRIHAKDGEKGHLDDFYFDDDYWIMRYMVVKYGDWLTGREVLISPEAFKETPNGISRYLSVNLMKAQVEKSPDLDTHKPVFRQQETDPSNNYFWPIFGPPTAGLGYGLSRLPVETKDDKTESTMDPHLRSVKEVKTYSIDATNGIIGHVEDFIVDDETWKLRYIVVNTQKWLPGGRQVLLAISCIDKINWVDSQISVKLTKEQIKNSRQANTLSPIDWENENHSEYMSYDKKD